MATRNIERHNWQGYFDRVSRDLPTSKVDVEVDAPDLGAQREFSRAVLSGLTYDPRDDAFSIITDGHEHRISKPRQIAVREEQDHLRAIEVVDGDDNKHIATLSEALKLPSQ